MARRDAPPPGVILAQLALVITLVANPTPATAPRTSTPTDRGDVSGGQAFFDAEDGDEEQNASEDADDDADYYDPSGTDECNNEPAPSLQMRCGRPPSTLLDHWAQAVYQPDRGELNDSPPPLPLPPPLPPQLGRDRFHFVAHFCVRVERSS